MLKFCRSLRLLLKEKLLALRSNQNADILEGFSFHIEKVEKMKDGRTRMRTSLGGKTFEAFGSDDKWANEALNEKVKAAVESGDITLNEI